MPWIPRITSYPERYSAEDSFIARSYCEQVWIASRTSRVFLFNPTCSIKQRRQKFASFIKILYLNNILCLLTKHLPQGLPFSKHLASLSFAAIISNSWRLIKMNNVTERLANKFRTFISKHEEVPNHRRKIKTPDNLNHIITWNYIDESRCFGRESISCSTCVTHYAHELVKSREWVQAKNDAHVIS